MIALRTSAALVLLGLVAAVPAASQQPERNPDGTLKRAEQIASQPVRDVGVSKVTIPPVLQAAVENPYGPRSTRNCAQLANGVKGLTAVLGPDLVAGQTANENRMGKLAEAGGKTIVNTLIPFRGLVREVSGAAPAQRRLEAAVAAGFARRGYLRGMQAARRCRKV